MRHDESERFAQALWTELYDALRVDGVHWLRASRLALRRARVAIYRLDGAAQATVAARLGVSVRTVKSDEAAVRGAVKAWALKGTTRNPVERVPLMPDQVPEQRRRRVP